MLTAFEAIQQLAAIPAGRVRDSLEGLFSSRFGCLEQLEYALWFARESGWRGPGTGEVIEVGSTIECRKCGRAALVGDDGVQCVEGHTLDTRGQPSAT